MAKKEITGSQRDESASVVADEDEEPQDPKEALKGVIKVAVSDAGTLRKTMTVTVPRDSINQELEKEYKGLVAEAIVPGFRRGRAPRRLIEKRFGGEVGEQVQTRLVSNAYLAAIEKQDLKVLGDPLLWVKIKESKSSQDGNEQLVDMRTALNHLKLPEDGDFEFKCEVEVKPEFKLPNLEGIKIERPALTISDEDVDVQINRLRAMRGNYAPVVNGTVEPDDLLICDMVMTVGGKEVKKAENIQIAARPQRIESAAFNDFGDKIKGTKVGKTVTLEGELAEDYEVEELRGKKAKFELTLNDIKRMNLPPMDKAFLEAQGFESEQEYRAWVRQRMESQLESELKRGMRNQARKYLLDNTKLELPEGLSTRQTERAVLRKMIDLQRQGVPMAEIEKHADELRTIAQQETTAELKLHFIIEEIAEELETEVSEEDINGAIAMMAQTYNRRFDRVRDELAKNDGIEMLYLQIRDEKCIDKLLEKAKITDAEVPQKGGAKAEKPAKAAKAPQDEPKEQKKAEKPAAPKAAAEKGAAKKSAADKPKAPGSKKAK
jgi:trigger factor